MTKRDRYTNPFTPEQVEQIQRQFSYNPETGAIVRLFSTTHNAKIGVDCSIACSGGYRNIRINSTKYMAHRIAWLLAHGSLPAAEIDHINCNHSDNRLCNLRIATPAQNQANAPLRRDNKSGFKGVRYLEKRGVFEAFIKRGGIRTHLGYHKSAETAHAAYAAAAVRLSGEFARFK